MAPPCRMLATPLGRTIAIKGLLQENTLKGLKFPTRNNFPTSKVEIGSFWPKTFSVFWGQLGQLLWSNRLVYAESS